MLAATARTGEKERRLLLSRSAAGRSRVPLATFAFVSSHVPTAPREFYAAEGPGVLQGLRLDGRFFAKIGLYMIKYSSDQSTLASEGQTLSDTYAQNKPWPHIVLDDFIDPEILEQVRQEAAIVRRSEYYEKFVDRKTDHNKYAFKPDAVGPETSRLINFLNSGAFVSYLEKLTGISGLLTDPSYFGGGLHKIQPGGYLEVHTDFNHLRRYNLERRLNLLLYLNKDWQPSYNGSLEMWERSSMSRVTAVPPIFNRCVVFSTTNESLHGHPLPLATPQGVERMSIALYYYTNTWNATEQEHSTLFHISQDNKVRIRPSRIYRSMVRTLLPPIFRNSFRAVKQLVRGEKISSIWE
jgi:Rps23 Pro-64 3,4-dihydroxylase Tpa1-like proline 4-hydroxylase